MVVFGGTNANLFPRAGLTSIEIFKPGTSAWRDGGTLRVARTNASAIELADGRVLVIGGQAALEDPTALATAEIYDPSTGTSVYTDGGMSVARSEFGAVPLPG